MFYKIDREQLVLTKDQKKFYICLGTFAAVALASFILGRYAQFKSLDKFEKELVVLNLEKERNRFTEEKLIQMLQDLNVKFPHIALAQAKLETGNFKSAVFKENNNLFGMKEARVRVNTAKGTSLNHAYYDNWQESVYDYAFYQCRYMSNAGSESEYFRALDGSYAKVDGSYSKALKKIIETDNLKSKF